MRCLASLAVAAVFCCVIPAASAQLRLCEVMYWEFQGPVESIEEKEFHYDYDTEAIATKPKYTRVYRFDDKHRLQAIEATDAYGKTIHTLAYDDAGRMKSLRRTREIPGRRSSGHEEAVQRNEQGEITALTKEEFVGIVGIKLKRKIENEAEDTRRMIKTYEPEEDGGAPECLYLIDNNRLLAVLHYGAYSDPDRVKEARRFDEKGLLIESRSFSARDEPNKVTHQEAYKYEFDEQGNWLSRVTHLVNDGKPDKVWRKVTRVVTYRDE